MSSPDFDAPRRSKEFLRFIVGETLAGRGDELTQSAIATRVFGRKDDFDPVLDPIVRIQAVRLRRSLERYYLLSGKHDPVRIELPRGGYVPAFRAAVESVPLAAGPSPEPAGSSEFADDWPSVAIHPFQRAQPGSEQEASAARVTEQFALEMGRYGDVRSLLQPEAGQRHPSRRESRFSLRGCLREEDDDLRVTARVVDETTGEQVWGDEYHAAQGPGRRSGTLDDIGRVIAARVGADEGVIVQLLAAERRKSKAVNGVTPFGAMLLSYEFFLTRDPQRLGAALQALRQVVQADPHAAVSWTRLGRLCFANHAFEVTSIPTPIDKAIEYAQHGVRLDPAGRRGRSILAAVLLVNGELDSARDELEEALRLSPDSLVYLEVIGMYLAFLGDGTRGPALIRTARERNPYAVPIAMMGLWFDHLRRGEVELAYQAALEYHDPVFFWRGVMRGTCLGLLGRKVDAALEVAEVLERKPDFRARGRILIGNLIKFPDVMSRVVEGLARAGLELA